MVSLAGYRPRMSSCVAKSRAVVYRLDATGWKKLVSDPDAAGMVFRRGAIRALAQQLRVSNAQLTAGAAAHASAAVEAHGDHLGG
jgi:hypothetical protein